MTEGLKQAAISKIVIERPHKKCLAHRHLTPRAPAW